MSEAMDLTNQITSPITQAQLDAMVDTVVETLMPRMATVIKNEITEFEERMAAQYIPRNEFEELRGKFNALPSKLAPAAEVEEMQRRVTEAEAKTQLLSGQMTTLMGNQSQLRDSVLQMRENEARTNQERAQLQTTLNLTMGILDNNRAVMQNVHEEQEAARRDRDDMRRKHDDLKEVVAGTQAWQRDSDARFQTIITRVHDLLFGSTDTNQVGLPKQIELLGNQIAATNTKLAASMDALDEYKDWVDKRRNLEKMWREKIWEFVTRHKALTVLSGLASGGIVIKIIELLSGGGTP
jgi:DNA repair exonuclease SbcCD ATPase subunit